MAPPASAQSALVVLILLGAAVSAAIYIRAIRGLRRDGGLVDASGFTRVDLVVGLALAAFFGTLVALSFGQPQGPQSMSAGKLLVSSLTFAAITAALISFLHYRGAGVLAITGINRVPPLRVIGNAVLLLLGAFPIVALASAVVQQFSSDVGGEQELVQVFRDAAARGDTTLMAAVFFTGVIMAPICEELLFRGYFYGVGKRFAGPRISAVATSLLFAVFHGNLVSLAGLAVLALALTIAYERTGSLAVPITMHALFNGTSLGILYLQATGRLGI